MYEIKIKALQEASIHPYAYDWFTLEYYAESDRNFSAQQLGVREEWGS
jgi:hypothetical protein